MRRNRSSILTFWHSSRICTAPMVADSGLSLMSKFTTCTGSFVALPASSSSDEQSSIIEKSADRCTPCVTVSKTLFSHVMTTSKARVGENFSGPRLIPMFRSSIATMPFSRYLHVAMTVEALIKPLSLQPLVLFSKFLEDLLVCDLAEVVDVLLVCRPSGHANFLSASIRLHIEPSLSNDAA